jgi:aryl-alcohol dehydrogenase-like predicted oxidoreductase
MGMSWAYNPEDRDDERSIGVIHRALELGVTLIDTADVYGPFTNEELVGRALSDRRADAVLATKCGLEVQAVEPLQMARNGRPEHVREAIDASLRRLGTDHVDLYQLHRVDPGVPVAETWGAMAEVVAAGKARAIGMSEATAEELAAAHAIHPVASLQSELSLWERGPVDDGVLDWCREHGAAFIPFAPLGRGFLTGQVTRETISAGDMRGSNPRFAPEAMDHNRAIVDRVRAVAERHDATPGQVALAWLLAQYDAMVPIPGTRRPERLEENAAAARLALTPEDLAELDALPAPTGERYRA